MSHEPFDSECPCEVCGFDDLAVSVASVKARWRREFAWMTVHDYQADIKAGYPYRDYRSLDNHP